MEARPKIKIKIAKVDKAIEWVCLIILIILWIGTIAGFSRLPGQIPSHFNAAGQADDYSNRISIFSLPIVATIIYAAMTILNRFPHVYNYPATVTTENAPRLYTLATRLIRILKLSVILVFTGIVSMTFKTVFADDDRPVIWFLPALLALMFIPMLVYLLSNVRWKSKENE